jgi:polyamine oxidase
MQLQGLGTEGGPENPIWTLAKKYNISNVFSDYSSIATFDETGAVDYTDLLDEFEEAWTVFEQDAGRILTENLQDRSMRAGLSMADWKSKKSMAAQAVEWWMWGSSPKIP